MEVWSDRGKTVYPPPVERGYKKVYLRGIVDKGEIVLEFIILDVIELINQWWRIVYDVRSCMANTS